VGLRLRRTLRIIAVTLLGAIDCNEVVERSFFHSIIEFVGCLLVV